MLTSIVTPSATVFATTITKETKSITLNVKSKQTMYVGTSRKIKVKSVKPTGTSKKVTYKSSNASVVKVTKTGTIKALKEVDIPYTGFGENYEDSRENYIVEKGNENFGIGG